MTDYISGVELFALKVFKDERGSVMHMLKADHPAFQKFGEIYFSTIKPGIIKGWKRHKEIAQLMAVPVGVIRMVIYDNRPESPTLGKVQIIDFGRDNYALLKMPPRVWYSFKSLDESESMIANCIDQPHRPDECDSLPLSNQIIPFSW